jgi:hypothetical protein
LDAAQRGGVLEEVRYLVLPDPTNPWLLARVRWPDVYEAISPTQPHWQADVGLFDLPYDPRSTVVSRSLAAAIAAEWGAKMPSAGAVASPAPEFVRRMPAKWSDLSPAEKRVWSIDLLDAARHTPAGRSRSRRWGRRTRPVDAPVLRPAEALTPITATTGAVIDLTDRPEAAVIDLADRSDDRAHAALTTAEDA